MVASQLIWLIRTRKMRARAAEAGETFDESTECIQWQAKGFDLGKMFTGLFSNSNDDIEQADTLVTPEAITPKTVPNAVV
jgi:hypothetical protein